MSALPRLKSTNAKKKDEAKVSSKLDLPTIHADPIRVPSSEKQKPTTHPFRYAQTRPPLLRQPVWYVDHHYAKIYPPFLQLANESIGELHFQTTTVYSQDPPPAAAAPGQFRHRIKLNIKEETSHAGSPAKQAKSTGPPQSLLQLMASHETAKYNAPRSTHSLIVMLVELKLVDRPPVAPWWSVAFVDSSAFVRVGFFPPKHVVDEQQKQQHQARIANKLKEYHGKWAHIVLKSGRCLYKSHPGKWPHAQPGYHKYYLGLAEDDFDVFPPDARDDAAAAAFITDTIPLRIAITPAQWVTCPPVIVMVVHDTPLPEQLQPSSGLWIFYVLGIDASFVVPLTVGQDKCDLICAALAAATEPSDVYMLVTNAVLSITRRQSPTATIDASSSDSHIKFFSYDQAEPLLKKEYDANVHACAPVSAELKQLLTPKLPSMIPLEDDAN